MNYAEIKNCDIANGLGVRVSLFVSGCTHHCKNCFNQMTWDFDYGQVFDESERRFDASVYADDTAVHAQIVIFRHAPLFIRIILVILFAFFVGRLYVVFHFIGRHARFHGEFALYAEGERRMDVYLYTAFHNGVGTPAYEHARTFVRKLTDQV